MASMRIAKRGYTSSSKLTNEKREANIRVARRGLMQIGYRIKMLC